MFDAGLLRDAVIVAPDRAIGRREPSADYELMLREANHRMKNTLTLLAARLRLDLGRSGSAKLERSLDRFEGRIVAFGRLYHLLSDGADDAEMSVAEYLCDLCGALSAAILEPSGLRCEAAIEDGSLNSEQCRRLGLIVTELVTNAAKHAFPDRKAGLVRVDARHRNGAWHCAVADNGVGAAGALQGSGGRILAGLVGSMRAQMRVETGRHGTTVKVVLPALR